MAIAGQVPTRPKYGFFHVKVSQQMATVEITARRDVAVTPYAVIAAPDILREVKNLYTQFDRSHVRIPLMTSVGRSPTGKHTVAASVSVIFEAGAQP